jgi:transglutaminase-like putative cysteine protease
MQIRAGFEMVFQCRQPTPMVLALNIHPSRACDLLRPDQLVTRVSVPVTACHDLFGNRCSRLLAPAGRFVVGTDALVNDSGAADDIAPWLEQTSVDSLPDSTLVFLLGSRCCDTEQLAEIAWRRFGEGPTGWARVQAICDFVHRHIEFGYPHARATRTALEAYNERRGVCRDDAHLAIALCRCMNFRARCCTGYLSDIGTEPPYGRWTWQPGSRPTSAGAGTPSTLATTRRGSAVC